MDQNKNIGRLAGKQNREFVMPAGVLDCSLAGEMSVIKQGPSNPLTQLSYEIHGSQEEGSGTTKGNHLSNNKWSLCILPKRGRRELIKTFRCESSWQVWFLPSLW
jgi:hypothetical protein